MKVEIKIEPECKENKIVIITDKITDEIQKILSMISQEDKKFSMIPVYGDKKIEFISVENISRIYTVSGKVVILSDKKEYTTKYRLYELEEILGENFIRVSNTDIVNIKKVKNFDMSITGSIHINFVDGDSVYASRRYISAIKKQLGI